mmetsp:Transcript_2626/g.7951  ORF Transcript_2626/g.7951 Transcript_2626/m.7951 type:complete len:221 (+) Transcript_2626:683-1345(+)
MACGSSPQRARVSLSIVHAPMTELQNSGMAEMNAACRPERSRSCQSAEGPAGRRSSSSWRQSKVAMQSPRRAISGISAPASGPPSGSCSASTCIISAQLSGDSLLRAFTNLVKRRKTGVSSASSALGPGTWSRQKPTQASGSSLAASSPGARASASWPPSSTLASIWPCSAESELSEDSPPASLVATSAAMLKSSSSSLRISSCTCVVSAVTSLHAGTVS